MIKQRLRQLFRLSLLGSLWGLLVYSVLFGGFSNSLADYYGGGGMISCMQTGCTNVQPYSCNGPGTIQGCVLYCAGGASIQCHRP